MKSATSGKSVFNKLIDWVVKFFICRFSRIALSFIGGQLALLVVQALDVGGLWFDLPWPIDFLICFICVYGMVSVFFIIVDSVHDREKFRDLLEAAELYGDTDAARKIAQSDFSFMLYDLMFSRSKFGRDTTMMEWYYEYRLECCREAAERGDVEAQIKLGHYYSHDFYGDEKVPHLGLYVGKNVSEALKWYCKAAELGNVEAQRELGNLYHGELNDDVEAAKWFCLAAEQGDAASQCRLGLCYEEGLGVEKNEAEAKRWYCKAAERGDGEAQYRLGRCYAFGIGVEKNISKALEWQYRSVAQGNCNAMFHLWWCYAFGIGVEKNLFKALVWQRRIVSDDEGFRIWLLSGHIREEGLEWCLSAAEQGNVRAQFKLGDFYKHGVVVEEDVEMAVKWYRKAAEQGNAEAQCYIGFCYENGQGVEKDADEAVKWYRKAAEQGDATSQDRLGRCYAFGVGVPEDKEEAEKWYRKAAEQGNLHAQFAPELFLPDYEKETMAMIGCLRSAAMQGNAKAQCEMGSRYKFGIGVEKDEEESVKWYRKAAEMGDAEAQCEMGFCYKIGIGVEKDEEEAVKWYSKAAKRGNADAQESLGCCYYWRGRQFDLDRCWPYNRYDRLFGNHTFDNRTIESEAMKWYREAVKWYRKAAEKGNAEAQRMIGICYEYGVVVEKDAEEAVNWYHKAAEQGNTEAQCKMGFCYENGQGVERDEEKALNWYCRAVETEFLGL